VSETGSPIEIRPLPEQPRVRVAVPGSAPVAREGVDWFRVGGEQPLDLEPALAFDQFGKTQKLPKQMPEQAAIPLFAATQIGAIIATAPSLRSYLLTQRGELILDSVDDSPNVWRRAEGDWSQLAALRTTPTAHHRQVILLGGQRHGYWHWWIDILPRVWLLEEFGALYNTVAPLAIPPLQLNFQVQSLELLGLAPRLELLEPGLTQFTDVTFTRGLTGGGSRYPARSLVEYVHWLRDRLAPAEATSPGRSRRRLFVSRASASSRRIVNEPALEPVLAEYGFEVVDPAELSIAEQVAMFWQADAVVGPHGGGLTNLLFAGPRTLVVEIFAAPAAQEISNYRVLSSHLGFSYCRLLGEAIPTEQERGPHYDDIWIDPHQLEQTLRLVL
jgi:capsular polysaccharide biosynthesis protein